MERRVRLGAMVMGILCVAVIRGQLRAAALSDSALVEARNKAASCLARDFDGGAFRDPYPVRPTDVLRRLPPWSLAGGI